MANDVKRLYRSRDNRMLGGVAAGLGEYLDIDPTIIRLIFAFSVFLGGTGALVYFVMWLVVPEEPIAEVTVEEKPAPKKSAAKKSSSTKKSAS
jgi:phage shock protein C